jgi:hypothetical protein
MQQCQISLDIDTTNPTVALGVEVWVDNTLLLDVAQVDQLIPVTHIMHDTENQHELRIILKNKLEQHTTIDADGNIVSDARLVVNNVMFDQIPLGQILIDQAVYCHDNNSHTHTVQEKFYGELGCNGTVSLKFTTPIYVWLLENM